MNNKVISKRQMRVIYPKADYLLNGEINKKDLKNEDCEQIIKKLGFYNRRIYKVCGYIVDQNRDGYDVVYKSRIPCIILSALLIILLACGGYYLWQHMKSGPDIDPSIKNYISNLKRPENLDATRILIPSFGTMTMDAGTSILPTILFNPDKNPCYFQFTIEDIKSKEVLYESKLVPPGKAVGKLELKKKMNAGVYPVKVKITTYDLNNYKVKFNGAEVETEISALR